MDTPSDAPKTAESSSAGTPITVPREAEAYAEWRQTGKLPARAPAQPEAKESAPSEKSESDTAPAAERGGQQQEKKARPRSNAETRLQELLEDLKRAGLTPAELKTFKRQMEAQPARETAQEPEPPKRPKLEDFDSYEKYEEAREKYFEELADYRAQQKLREYEQRQRELEAQRATQEKLNAAKTRYGETAVSTIARAAKEIFEDRAIPPVIKAIVNDSPVIADLLYVMGSQPEDFQEFVALAKTNPGQAIRKAVLLERLVAEELAKSAVAPEAEKPAAKKVTQAPPPPKEVSGRAAAPPDEIESAVTRNDFAAFRQAANRRDLARHQGR